MKNATASPATCTCPAGQVCVTCLGPELALRLQLKLSLAWAKGPAELRERRRAAEHLSQTAAQN